MAYAITLGIWFHLRLNFVCSGRISVFTWQQEGGEALESKATGVAVAGVVVIVGIQKGVAGWGGIRE